MLLIWREKMKSGAFRLSVGVTALALLMGAGGLYAQGAGARGGKDDQEQVRITRFPPPGKTSMVRTPEFSYNVNNVQQRVTRRPREWALFEVKYDTAAKWIDELKFDYHLMTKGKDDERKDIYSYYTASVRYVDIPKGTHMSCVALPPSLVERYGDPIAIALEVVSKDGTVLDRQEMATGITLPKEWWRDPAVMDKTNPDGTPFMARRAGLLERSKTPFALINPDDYEVVQ